MQKICYHCMGKYEEDQDSCPWCGYVATDILDIPSQLPPGTVLNGTYVVGNALGSGGTGITYIALDEKLQRKVAIKEYMPSECSTRDAGEVTVRIFSHEKWEQFHDGLRKFMDEAQHLAQFRGEKGIVEIYNCFQANNTAYIVMEYLEGESVGAKLEKGEKYTEEQAISMLMPVMESMQKVHEGGVIHRGICPDNLIVTKAGVKLIDFGSSRFTDYSFSRSLNMQINSGYSPEEQYRHSSDQGPYTDVYSMAATLYRMITGVTPPEAMTRRVEYEQKGRELLKDPHKFVSDITPNHENAILNALNSKIANRTPDMATFIGELKSEGIVKRKVGRTYRKGILGWSLAGKIALGLVFAGLLALCILLGTGIISFKSSNSNESLTRSGYVTVPDVYAEDYELASSMLELMGLDVERGNNIESDNVAAGLVQYQEPGSGMELPKGGTVRLYVSSGVVVAATNGVATVPYVINETESKAISTLILAGLGEPEITEDYSADTPKGMIISQYPEAGVSCEVGSVVAIVVSKGPEYVTVPNISDGKYISNDAALELSKLGFDVQLNSVETDDYAENIVFDQSLSAGSSVVKGSQIVLSVATATPTVEMPVVVGHSREEVVPVLERLGFVVEITDDTSGIAATGIITSADIDEGIQCKLGTVVNMTVSTGKVDKATPTPKPKATATPSPTKKVTPTPTQKPKATPTPSKAKVPDVYGKTYKEAKKALEKKGFKVKKVEKEYFGATKDAVMLQSPAAGENAKYGSDVVITICVNDWPFVPDCLGKTKSKAISMLEELGFTIADDSVYTEVQPDFESGQVYKTQPKAGNLSTNGIVKIWVNP